MSFTVESSIEQNVAKITIAGRMTATDAVALREKVEEAAAAKVEKLVLFMSDLEYMPSAGLRVLVFARQKMGPSVEILAVGVQDIVQETLEMSGFIQAIKVVDSYPA